MTIDHSQIKLLPLMLGDHWHIKRTKAQKIKQETLDVQTFQSVRSQGPDRHAVIQVSTCSSYDVGHPAYWLTYRHTDMYIHRQFQLVIYN